MMKPSIKFSALLLAFSNITQFQVVGEEAAPQAVGGTATADAPKLVDPAYDYGVGRSDIIPAGQVERLKVGSPAPEFKVAKWYKGGPVKIEPKGTYIIECWATWCGPCVAAFPHLSELAKVYEGKVTVVGVGVWNNKVSVEDVQKFVDNQGDKMSYIVAGDRGDTVALHWLKASEQYGIPTAYIVHEGILVWVGHPSQMNNKLLDSILDGTYDLKSAAHQAERDRFSRVVSTMIKTENYAGAVSRLEEMKVKFPELTSDLDKRIEDAKKRMKAAGK